MGIFGGIASPGKTNMNISITIFPVLLVVLLGVPSWAHLPKSGPIYLDFCAKLRARKVAADCGTKVKWYDLYAKHPHLREEYPARKIEVRADDIHYSTVTRKVDRPGYVYVQWFKNGGSLPIKGILHMSKAVTSTFSWEVSESLKVGAEVNIDAGIPAVIEGNIQINTELNLASTQGRTDTTVDTFTVAHEIKIPPKSKVEGIVTITETELEVPWTAMMYVTGMEAVWLVEKCADHWLWFFPIEQLAACEPRLNVGQTPYGYGLSFRSSGVFKAVRAIKATVHTKEYPL